MTIIRTDPAAATALENFMDTVGMGGREVVPVGCLYVSLPTGEGKAVHVVVLGFP